MPDAYAARKPTPELVAEHGAFVRRLAAELCRSSAEADDLAQETWLAALRKPPRDWSSARGWLARVTRRMAGRAGRAERRREDREQLAVRAAESSHEREVDHAAVLREVVDALDSLDAEARRIVTARHFEGLELAALARREGIALSTLKARLARAHEELRRALDARSGGERRRWQLALLPFTGSRSPVPPHAPSRPEAPVRHETPVRPELLAAPLSATVPFGLGTLVSMGITAKLAGALAVGGIVAAGLALKDPPPPATPIAPVTPAAADEERSATALDAVEREERAPVAAAAAPEPDAAEIVLPQPFGALATFTVQVTDLDGLPAPGVEVLAAPPDQPLNVVGRTGDDGELRFDWRHGDDAPELVVAIRSNGEFAGGLRKLRATPFAERELTIRLDPSLLPGTGAVLFTSLAVEHDGTARVTGRALSARKRVDALRSEQLAFESRLVELTDKARSARGEQGAPKRRRRGPSNESVERLAGDEVAFVLGASAGHRAIDDLSAASYELVTLRAKLDRSDEVRLALRTKRLAFRGADAAVQGRVRDASGLPASSARVTARQLEVEEPAGATATCDADGNFRLDLPAGKYEIIAGNGRDPGSRGIVDVLPGETAPFEGFVDRRLTLVGQVVDVEGKGIAGVHVEGTAPNPGHLGGGDWVAVAVTDAEGRFVLPHCVSDVIAVDLTSPDDPLRLPVARFDGVALGSTPWVATLDVTRLGEVRIGVLDEEPDDVLAAELVVWDALGARGARVPLTGTAGSDVTVRLPYGAWSLALRADGPHQGGRVDIDVREVDPPAPFHAGTLDVGTTGWLELPEPGVGETWRIDRIEDDRAPERVWQAGHGVEPSVLPLPDGTYRLTVRTGEEARLVRAEELRVVTGRRTQLR